MTAIRQTFLELKKHLFWIAVVSTLAILIAFVCVVSYWASHPDYVKRFDQPLTYNDAISMVETEIPIPDSSSDIYWAMYADWQAYTEILRFTAPVEDCITHIDTVTVWYNKLYNKQNSFPRMQISQVDPQGAGWLKTADWFTPENITNGIHIGKKLGPAPQIWIDLDKGNFYFKAGD